MKFNEILSQVKSILTNFTGANLSFGKPMTVNEMTIIPVAKTSFGFGGGGGNSSKQKYSNALQESKKPEPSFEPISDPTEPQNEDQAETPTPPVTPEESYGGGGGGGLRTNPIGIYVIRGESVKFYPVLRYDQILATLTVISAIIIRFIKLKRK